MSLHILGPEFSTFVRSVRLYCEEKNLAYSHGMTFEGELVGWRGDLHYTYHPFAKFPVLFHGRRYISETSTILRYLDAVFPSKKNTSFDLTLQTEIDQWCNALSTSVDQAVVRNYLLLVAGPNSSPPVDDSTRAVAETGVKSILATLSKKLDAKLYLCGNSYTAADALLTPMLDYLASLDCSVGWFDPWPKLHTYLERMRSRQSGQLVLCKYQAGTH